MKSIPKLIRRFVKILILSAVLLILVNIVLLLAIGARQTSGGRPYFRAETALEALEKTSDGYKLSEEMTELLQREQAWGIYIDNQGSVVWHTDNLPESVPLQYTVSDIASLTRGYIDGYPTFTGGGEDGLMVLGYPKDSYWKLLWSAWDYQLIANAPKIFLTVVVINVTVIFMIYVIVNSRLLRFVEPIINGIQSLPTDEPVHIKEKGLLSELAVNINRTSEMLQSQKYQLRKKETARANWIAGVSHDIRTPLSMVMGYAQQLQSDTHLTEEERKKASIILNQSERIRNLINDLNLASKLEYNMQPLQSKEENVVAIVRQVVVDFINTGMGEQFPIEWITDDNLTVCMVKADRDLLKRAVSNLIQNCINHNETGCTIYVSVQAEENNCVIRVEDNGIGVSDEQLDSLNKAPHYMVCDTNTTGQRHGLGLLIVKQIIASHQGTITMEHSAFGGFAVEIKLPME